MEETLSVDVHGEKRAEGIRPVRRGLPLASVLSFVVGLVGVAALGASAWVYSETQRDVLRLSTEMAQFRVSLELFARQQGTPSATDNAGLQDLSNRLGILEESWRNAPAQSAGSALPATPTAPVTATAASGGDCLPTGTRFLVTAGDTYPVCGFDGKVEIGGVDNGFMSLSDGTVIAAGGNIPLPNSACMIGVVSAGEGGMTGFAEIRVTC